MQSVNVSCNYLADAADQMAVRREGAGETTH